MGKTALYVKKNSPLLGKTLYIDRVYLFYEAYLKNPPVPRKVHGKRTLKGIRPYITYNGQKYYIYKDRNGLWIRCENKWCELITKKERDEIMRRAREEKRKKELERKKKEEERRRIRAKISKLKEKLKRVDAQVIKYERRYSSTTDRDDYIKLKKAVKRQKELVSQIRNLEKQVYGRALTKRRKPRYRGPVPAR